MAGKSYEHQLTRQMRIVVTTMMKRDGRDFSQCELCPATIPEGQHQLHHTKYDGATYKDIKVVCRSCNNKFENKFLA
jgi:5-methylcytosine-specific restriction endonuclease McrA